ncbi:reverse transcriptase domain-containing protein [Thiolapillus sp.]|uniref:reverse transcriptase domain-containing protein n=1 Tax=Thiolapillus sp. TaxID=2017437 RepID=UPI003AF8AE20
MHYREATTTPARFVSQLRDFKKAFDGVRHAGLWQVLRSFNIEGLVQSIQALYENSSTAVLLNSQLGESFKTTVDVRQGCLLSPILFNLFLDPREDHEEALHDHHTSISFGGRPIYNVRFADDIDFLGGSKGELQDLTDRLVDKVTANGMKVSTEVS